MSHTSLTLDAHESFSHLHPHFLINFFITDFYGGKMTFCDWICRPFELLEVHSICVSLGVCLFSIIFTSFSFCSFIRFFIVLFLLKECSLSVILIFNWRIVFVTSGVLLPYCISFTSFFSWQLVSKIQIVLVESYYFRLLSVSVYLFMSLFTQRSSGWNTFSFKRGDSLQ